MRGTIRVESHYHYFTVAVSIVAVQTLAASALEWFSLTGKVGWSIDPRKGPPDSHLAAKQNTTSRASGIPYYAYGNHPVRRSLDPLVGVDCGGDAE
jgi:hypothetical protein